LGGGAEFAVGEDFTVEEKRDLRGMKLGSDEGGGGKGLEIMSERRGKFGELNLIAESF